MGVTVTVTLQDPAFNALTEVPTILQFFAEVGATLTTTFDVAATTIFE